MGDPRRLTESKDVLPVVLYAKRDNALEDASPVALGAGLSPWDYVSLAISAATETYSFAKNGSSGTTVGTIVIVYTDSNRTTVSNVTVTRSV